MFPGISDFLVPVEEKPKMLFVDDRSKRIHYALDVYGKEYDVTIAPNVPEALRLLSARKWDVVSLDFDLNGHDFQNPDDPTCGMEIIRYLQKCTVEGSIISKPAEEFWLHSSNKFGAHLMAQSLFLLGYKWRYVVIDYEGMS